VAVAALLEFHRFLGRGGWAVILGNERDESDAATLAYGKIIGGTKEAAAVEEPRRKAATPLWHCPLFCHPQQRLFGHEQDVDEEGLVGRAFSASYAPREQAAAQRFAADLHAVFAAFSRDGRFRLRYVTSVDVAQRL
jgi:hypothetical protein